MGFNIIRVPSVDEEHNTYAASLCQRIGLASAGGLPAADSLRVGLAARRSPRSCERGAQQWERCSQHD